MNVIKNNIVFLSVGIVACLFTLGIVEVTFRLLQYDFLQSDQAFEALPIYYRMPTVPVGAAFYRRPGPASWRGKVLATYARIHGDRDGTYSDELESTFEYDKDGFRNPLDLTDWEIAVVGDSFVELGYLSYEQLYTTRLGKALGRRVKNLGVSQTGPLTYQYYLDNYGRAPSVRDAVMIFYEGNDLGDLEVETKRLERAMSTGQRELRELPRQTSLIRFLLQLPKNLAHKNAWHEFLRSKGTFQSKTGPVPIGVLEVPPKQGDIDDKRKKALGEALASWANTAREMGARPWLLYMPCKLRVTYGLVEFNADAPSDVVNWKPDDLSGLVMGLAEQVGIHAISVLDELRHEAESGVLPYNGTWDSHLNDRGSVIVSQVLVKRLAMSP
jgi:hypothetical protein